MLGEADAVDVGLADALASGVTTGTTVGFMLGATVATADLLLPVKNNWSTNKSHPKTGLRQLILLKKQLK